MTIKRKYHHIIWRKDTDAGLLEIHEFCRSDKEARERVDYLNEVEKNYFLSYYYEKRRIGEE